ncbi:hypothetical protein FB451DRAFT_1180643 [Mycena latifolia]|nr:hypothetical protein FB451DRAFT_1180643 [Mycena latifolia]
MSTSKPARSVATPLCQVVYKGNGDLGSRYRGVRLRYPRGQEARAAQTARPAPTLARLRLYAAISLKGQWVVRPLRKTLEGNGRSPCLSVYFPPAHHTHLWVPLPPSARKPSCNMPPGGRSTPIEPGASTIPPLDNPVPPECFPPTSAFPGQRIRPASKPPQPSHSALLHKDGGLYRAVTEFEVVRHLQVYASASREGFRLASRRWFIIHRRVFRFSVAVADRDGVTELVRSTGRVPSPASPLCSINITIEAASAGDISFSAMMGCRGCRAYSLLSSHSERREASVSTVLDIDIVQIAEKYFRHGSGLHALVRRIAATSASDRRIECT